MPLRAIVAGREVIAPDLSDAEWDALRDAVAATGASVILPCCGREGYLRRSKFGTPHFAHKRGADCDARGETIQHLKAKADIMIACRQAGFSAVTEVVGGGAGSDWRADVLATRGSVRIAFEVQWSFLRLQDAVFRQERYARDGVRGCWFFRNPPPPMQRGDDLQARRDLPLFHLWANADGSFDVSLNGQLYPLPEIVTALLTGSIRFCETATARAKQTLDLIPFEIVCPTCARPTLVYRVAPLLTVLCGRSFSVHPLEFRREVLAALRSLTREQPHLRFGKFAEHVTDAGKKELRFTCIHCGAAITHDQIEMALYGTNRLLEAEHYEISVQFAQPITARAAHWCFPADGAFCCEA